MAQWPMMRRCFLHHVADSRSHFMTRQAFFPSSILDKFFREDTLFFFTTISIFLPPSLPPLRSRPTGRARNARSPPASAEGHTRRGGRNPAH